jgi:hypothetical protein
MNICDAAKLAWKDWWVCRKREKNWFERFQTDERRKLQLNGRCWDLESWFERFQVVEGKPELCGCCWVLKNLFGFRGFKQVE